MLCILTSLTSILCHTNIYFLLPETDTFIKMESLPKESPEDAKKESFWMVRIIFMIKYKKPVGIAC